MDQELTHIVPGCKDHHGLLGFLFEGRLVRDSSHEVGQMMLTDVLSVNGTLGVLALYMDRH